MNLIKISIDKKAFFEEFDRRHKEYPQRPGSEIYQEIEEDLYRQHKINGFDSYDHFRSAKSKHIRRLLRKK